MVPDKGSLSTFRRSTHALSIYRQMKNTPFCDTNRYKMAVPKFPVFFLSFYYIIFHALRDIAEVFSYNYNDDIYASIYIVYS